MNSNKVCIYDNPYAFRREYWRDGKLVGLYAKEFLDQAAQIITITKKSAKHLQPFRPGLIQGDQEAISSK